MGRCVLLKSTEQPLHSDTIHFGSRLMVFEIDKIKNFSSSIPSVVLGASIMHSDETMVVRSFHYECFSSE